MKIPFTKMHGCGNDFVIIDARTEAVQLSADERILIADRHRGIGCDQLIILEKSERADVFMKIYNPDASEAQACGNATRCVAALVAEANNITIETIERLLACSILENGEVSVNMGAATSHAKIDLGSDYESLGEAVAVNVGNPHCIFIVPDAEDINLANEGAKIEVHKNFPQRTNVEFVSHMDKDNFRVRVWERGAGITESCGSGAVATTWALNQGGLIKNHASLHMDGGTLHMTIADNNDIYMQGEVAHVFTGDIEL